MKNQNSQNETTIELEQIQKNETEKFVGLEFLEQERLKSVADLKAMLEMDEKEKEPVTVESSDSIDSK